MAGAAARAIARRLGRPFVGALLLAFGWFALATPVVLAQQTGVVTSRSTANSSTVQLAVPLGDVRTVPGLPEYIVTLYRYGLGIVTMVAIIMVVYGGFRYLLGATTGDVKTGRKVIEDAIGGMAVLFLAYVILYAVNPKTVRLQLPDIRRIQSVSIGLQSQAPGTSCSKDSDCTQGSACLRVSLVGGICSNGQAGNICRCKGEGCNVTIEDAGGAVNNDGRGSVDCQAGLRCEEVSADVYGGAGDYVCNGGVGAVCNLSSRYVLHVDPGQVASNIASTAWETATDMFDSLDSVSDIYHLPSSWQTRLRQPVNCREAGQFCFQSNEERAGACVFGDPRDMTMFEAVPEYRRNAGLQAAVERCDLTEAQVRELPKAEGGCRNLTNGGVDDFCVQHRYHCATGAVCGRSEYASLMDSTLAQYRSWQNAPPALRPEAFFKQGCRKPVGSACTSDGECSSKCLSGRCVGFGILAIADSVRPGTLRFGELPTRVDQVAYRSRPGDCVDETWTAIDMLFDETVRAAADPAIDAGILRLLFQAGTTERFACYPKRPAGARCDFGRQCVSGACSLPSGASGLSVPPTFNAPMENGVGLGTCSAS